MELSFYFPTIYYIHFILYVKNMKRLKYNL